MAKEKILVVEDERIVAKDIVKSLQRLGYKVGASVASGEEALQKVAEIQPDLVLMDIMLKGKLDGIETTEKIHENFDIPVVYLTAYADEKTLERAKITEPFGYIIKPFDERDLHTTIEIALRRHLAEAATRVALEKEKQLSELKSRFWFMVAHEFRNPLTAILSSAELLESYSHELSELKRREYFYLIQTSVHSLNNLLNEVLEFGKAEEGKLECKPESLDLVCFCRDLVEHIKFSSGSKHRIIFTNQGDCPDACLDEKLLRHIFSNLLVNAIKYSPEGSNIHFELLCENEKAVFQIKDNGIGIPPDDLELLFDSFHRATNVSNIPGHGLGLTIVKKCLDLQSGEIAVNSKVGVGTNFTVTLPLNICVIQDKNVRS
ncbi:ATP-binding protein [Coleofasciculus sp. FACHB-1120]|uniref:hybrid sensor histidine kinase/response regulator n=1 Tax=Coleofasciculus sp. FACHB-1120 TaxID=2692783 RepID=UPI001687B387|nr:ATP-binding protein [Coleofasciculus sp. FACHB-1120]MBD2744640.1 response regulator [Coleofasciculus sp. FACHB-1120]